jgi:hypothetical protein|tara:strand:- start:55 stop:489 length:435 start_codon:yes stop_codon:yes gene_type:complete
MGASTSVARLSDAENSARKKRPSEPKKLEIEPVGIEESVDENGEQCNIILYKEKGFRGREFAIKVKAGGSGSSTIESEGLQNPIRSVEVKGPGCDSADFEFRGYSGKKFDGKERLLETAKGRKKFPGPISIQSYKITSGKKLSK